MNSHTIKAIGFDLGETLIYFENVPLSWQSLYREALVSVAKICSVEPSETQLCRAAETLSRFNGRIHPRTIEITTEAVWGPILDNFNASQQQMDVAAGAFFDFFLGRRALYDDSLKTLHRLKRTGLPLGILTDVPYGMPKSIAARMLPEIEPLLDVWVTSVEVGFCKPDPHGLQALANRLNATPSEMVYIGNETKDMKAARAAGMFGVLVDRIGTTPECGEHWRIKSLEEFSIEELLRRV